MYLEIFLLHHSLGCYHKALTGRERCLIQARKKNP